MKRKPLARLLYLLAAVALAPPATVHAQQVIRIGGNGAAMDVIKLLTPGFQKKHPEIKIEAMKSLGSSGGIKALKAGALDIAMSSRPLKVEERSWGAVEVFHGRTPLVFAANRSVPKAGLSKREAEAIYSGKQETWPDGSQIKLVLRPEGDTDTKTMQAISPGMNAALKSALHRPGMQIALTDEDSDFYIGKVAGALGGSSLAQISIGRHPVKVLSFNGVKPGLNTMASGSYPLVKDIIVIVDRNHLSEGRAFVEYIASPQARKLLLEHQVASQQR